MTVVAGSPDAAAAARRPWARGIRALLGTIRRVRRPPAPTVVRPRDPGVALASFLDDGERRDRQIVALREQTFGPDHPDVANALHILGARYHLVRRYDEAEALYERTLAIRTERLGHDHPSTVEVLEDLGDLWRDRGDGFRAEAAYGLALAGVTDPERRRRKQDDYAARLAHIGAGEPALRHRPGARFETRDALPAVRGVVLAFPKPLSPARRAALWARIAATLPLRSLLRTDERELSQTKEPMEVPAS